MNFPFDLDPKGLPKYYQEIYDELIEGGESSQVTILPCLDTVQNHIVYVVVRIKLSDEASYLDDDETKNFNLSITPLALALPPLMGDLLKPILPNTEGTEFIPEGFPDIPDWDPPTSGVMKFPEESDE